VVCRAAYPGDFFGKRHSAACKWTGSLARASSVGGTSSSETAGTLHSCQSRSTNTV